MHSQTIGSLVDTDGGDSIRTAERIDVEIRSNLSPSLFSKRWLAWSNGRNEMGVTAEGAE
jgi:hypothetical protein